MVHSVWGHAKLIKYSNYCYFTSVVFYGFNETVLLKHFSGKLTFYLSICYLILWRLMSSMVNDENSESSSFIWLDSVIVSIPYMGKEIN